MLPGPPIEQFLLVVLPEHALELRKQVKYWSGVIEGYPTQCVVRRHTSTLSEDSRITKYSVHQSIALVSMINIAIMLPSSGVFRGPM